MEAIIFARVSTQEQAQEGYSVDNQISRLTDYCKRNGFQIIETFRVAESSSKDEKKEFNRMIKFAKTRRHKVAIVVDKVDRLNRSVKDLPKLEELMSTNKAELHFLDIGRLDSDANTTQKLMLRIMTTIGNTYTDNLSDYGKRTYKHKVENGECPGPAPIGYLNTRNEQGKATVIIDPVRGLLVAKIFKMYSTGTYSLGDLQKFASENNLTNTFFKARTNKPITKNVIACLLKNHFYYGLIQNKKNNRFYPHKYERLISRDLFEKCQQITAERSAKNNRVQSVSTMKSGKDFIFKGLVRCGVTGKLAVCDQKERGTYLIAYNPENPNKKIWINENTLLEEVESIFKSMKLPVDMVQRVIKFVNEESNKEIEIQKNKLNELNRTIGQLESRASRLIDMKLDGHIDQESFEKKKKELDEEIKKAQAGIELYQIGDEGFKKYVIDAFSLSSRVHELFTKADLFEKRNLINCVCSNIILNGKNPCISLRKPFNLMVNLGGCTEWLPETQITRTKEEEIYISNERQNVLKTMMSTNSKEINTCVFKIENFRERFEMKV